MITLTSAIIPALDSPRAAPDAIPGLGDDVSWPKAGELHWQNAAAWVCLTWYIVVTVICALGHIRMYGGPLGEFTQDMS